jgi:hypothetical protein
MLLSSSGLVSHWDAKSLLPLRSLLATDEVVHMSVDGQYGRGPMSCIEQEHGSSEAAKLDPVDANHDALLAFPDPHAETSVQTAIPILYNSPVQSKKRKLDTKLHQPRKNRPVFDAEIVKEMREW